MKPIAFPNVSTVFAIILVSVLFIGCASPIEPAQQPETAVAPSKSTSVDTVAQAQSCGTRDWMVSTLTTKYKEQLKGAGLTPGGELVELFVVYDARHVNQDTWSIIISNPEGKSCIIQSGGMWRDWTPPVGGGRT